MEVDHVLTFGQYASGGRVEEYRVSAFEIEEEKAEEAEAFAEKFSEDPEVRKDITEASTALFCVRHLFASNVSLKVDANDVGMIHMSLQRHEAYRLYELLSGECPPEIQEEVSNLQNGLAKLCTAVVSAMREKGDSCDCPICEIGTPS